MTTCSNGMKNTTSVTRRTFLKEVSILSTSVLLLQHDTNAFGNVVKQHEFLNPYNKVNWTNFKAYKAALHLHTLQSDGYHLLQEVLDTYKKRGFSIIAVTDHDWNYPNARVKWGEVPSDKASPYPIDPKPDNFPANPTWPWTDYGARTPAAMDLVGIQGNELTFRHHINSYFSDYGVWYERTGNGAPYEGIVDENGNIVTEDDQLHDIRKKNGLAFLNHPGISNDKGWWDRKSLDWYVERYKLHGNDYLIGIEVTNAPPNDGQELFQEGLWDQLLARFMPTRPIWGFGTDDMHRLDDALDSFTVFLLDSPTEESIRQAMLDGQFYFCKSSKRINLQEDDVSCFPTIEHIIVDREQHTIRVVASNYDEIKWISAPKNLSPIEDYRTSDRPWELGVVVGAQDTIAIRSHPSIKKYVRAELIRMEDGVVYRTFTNPFGLPS